MRILLAAFLLIAPLAAHAYQVISVADGDSLTLQVGASRLKLRLAGIDAPEIKQPFGRQAGQSLRRLCSGQDAQYDAIAIDRFAAQSPLCAATAPTPAGPRWNAAWHGLLHETTAQ